jgi:exoribonuclease R
MTEPLKIFVVGCGRSGTHWLGHTLGSHPDIAIQIEQEPAFSLVHAMAWDSALERTHMTDLMRVYEEAHACVRPKHFADKSHSNLWLAEMLADGFPEARFVAIRRRVLPTVASMLRHKGVLGHFARWEADPKPNRFLGVTDVATYRALSLEKRCALRVIVSSNEIDKLVMQTKVPVHVMEYEHLQTDPIGESQRLAGFLGIRDAFSVPTPQPESLEKWRTDLSEAQIDAIEGFARNQHASHLL